MFINNTKVDSNTKAEANYIKDIFKYLLGKELKEFKLILDCYIKLYAAFTKILNVVEIEKTLATLKSNLEEVEMSLNI